MNIDLHFDINLNKRQKEVYDLWLSGNEEIKEIGIESYWNKNKCKSHYKQYNNCN